MQHDWFMYHLRSTYTNRPDFPFNKRLVAFLDSHSILYKHQYGFRKKYSTKLCVLNQPC